MSPFSPNSVVVVTGAGGPAGRAVVRRLLEDDVRVFGIDARASVLAEFAESLGNSASGFVGRAMDLVDTAATTDFATSLDRVDGVVHLVGAYRGGSRFADNTMEDWLVLHDLLIRTVQNVTLAFHDALAAAPQGRFAMVSATAVTAPSAGSAGYAAAKAAAEVWTLALATSFSSVTSAGGTGRQSAAATVLVVKALVDDELRAARPDSSFPGCTDVRDLADSVAALWDADASSINGRRLVLAS